MALGELKKGSEKKSGAERTPYQDLYIYLLKGVVGRNDETGLGEAFLGTWVEDDSSFLFFSMPSDKTISRLVKLRSELEWIDDFHFTYEQWQGEPLKTVKAADFVIVPAWEKTTNPGEGLQILLDPGVVFGNGLHPTTRHCLEALSHAASQKTFEKVLDLGTGTGILALAAARKGAKSVLAVDLNPLCVKTAKQNIELNGLDEIIRAVEGPAEAYGNETADLLIANIHWEVINSLLNEDGFRKRERLLISGLMRSRRSDVTRQLRENHFEVIHEWDHEMTWFTMLAGKA
jgi:ribosomal protein L11 methyltransferase